MVSLWNVSELFLLVLNDQSENGVNSIDRMVDST